MTPWSVVVGKSAGASSKGGPDIDWLRGQLEQRGKRERFMIDSMVRHEQIADEVRKARIGISLFTSLAKSQNTTHVKFRVHGSADAVMLADLADTTVRVQWGERVRRAARQLQGIRGAIETTGKSNRKSCSLCIQNFLTIAELGIQS